MTPSPWTEERVKLLKKRVLSIVLSAAVLLGSFSATMLYWPQVFAEDNNLFENGGFEEEWNNTVPYVSGGVNLQPSNDNIRGRSEDAAHGGDYGWYITPGWTAGDLGFGFEVEPDKEYKVSFWYKTTENGTPFDGLSVTVKSVMNYGFDTNNPNGWLNMQATLKEAVALEATDGEWQEATFTFASGGIENYPNAADKTNGGCWAHLVINGAANGGTLCLDDIVVTEAAAVPDPGPDDPEPDLEQAFFNGFEEESCMEPPYVGLNNYEEQSWYTEGMRGRVQDVVRTGDYAYQVTNTVSWAVGNFDFGIPVEPNTDYTLTLWYRLTAAGAKLGVYPMGELSETQGAVSNNNIRLSQEKTLPTATEWTKVTITFNSGDAANYPDGNYVVLSVDGVPVGAQMRIDDIALAKTETEPEPDPGTEPEPGPAGDFINGFEYTWSEEPPYVGLNNYEEQSWYTEGMRGRVQDDVRSGSYSYQITNKVDWAVGNFSFGFPVEPNTDYTLTLWYKLTDSGASVNVYAMSELTSNQGAVPNDEITLSQAKTLDAANDWTPVTFTFNSGDAADYPDGQYYAVLDVDNLPLGAQLRIDDMSVVEGEAPPPTVDIPEFIQDYPVREGGLSYKYVPAEGTDLLADGGLEGSDGFWNADTFIQEGILAISGDSAAVHSGSKGLAFTADGAQRVTVLLEVEPDTEYLFGAWMKGDFFDIEENLNIFSWSLATESGTRLHERYLPAFDNEWHLCEYSFRTNEAETIMLTMSATDTTVFLDDFFLCKLEDIERYKPTLSTKDPAEVTDDSPALLGCDEEDNVFENFDLSDAEDTFWSDTDGSAYGKQIQIVDSGSSVYGNALRFKVTDDAMGNPRISGVSYIKWVDVEPQTEYVFSAKYSLVEPSAALGDSASYFALIDSNVLMPSVIQRFRFTESEYEKDPDQNWRTAAVSFHTGDYDRIGLLIYDAGGEAYLDDLRLFKASDAKALAEREDTFPASRLESSQNPVSNGLVGSVNAGTTVKSLVSSFAHSQYIRVYDAEGNPVENTAQAAATGMELRLMDGPVIKDRATVVVRGDLDGDGKATGADVDLLLEALVGDRELSAAQQAAADADGNGALHIYDALLRTEAGGQSGTASLKIEGPSTLVIGEPFEVTVRASAGLVGLSGRITYDSSKIIVQDVSIAQSGNWQLAYTNSKGTIQFAAVNTDQQSPTGENGELLTLTLVLASTVQTDDVIALSMGALQATDGKNTIVPAEVNWIFGQEEPAPEPEPNPQEPEPEPEPEPDDPITPPPTPVVDGNEDPEPDEPAIVDPGEEENGPSNNNLLASLEIEGVTLSPAFDPETKTYEATVPFEVENVNVTAVPQDAAATVTIDGTELTYVGRNIVKAVVVSESGLQRTYKVYVTRQEPVQEAAGLPWWGISLIVVGAVLVAGAAVVTVLLILRKRKASPKTQP